MVFEGLVGGLVIDSSCRGSEFPALTWGDSEPSVALALDPMPLTSEDPCGHRYMYTCVPVLRLKIKS